jgi:hypothetical protein
MSNDHFVAQIYLRHFGDPARGGMMYAYRKSKRDEFPCHPRAVCHEWDGDLNPLLASPELLGDYRKLFEPRWRASVATLLENVLSPDDKFAISGYFANLMVCTPAWIRVARSVYDRSAVTFLTAAKRIASQRGDQSKLPVEAIEMLEDGRLTLSHDPNFVKGVPTNQLIEYAWRTYHQTWTIIRNRTEFPFITSDNPVAIDQRDGVLTRYLPITPALCLSVRYDRVKPPDLDPKLQPRGSIEWIDADAELAKSVNTLTAMCAEDLVFTTQASPGVKRLVQNNARFGIECDLLTIPSTSTVEYQMAAVCIRDRRSPPN